MKPVLVAVLLVASGVTLDVYGGSHLSMGFASARWPTVDGTINSSEMETARSRRAANYVAKVTYSYTVDGHLYSGDQLSFGNEAYGSMGDVQAMLKRFPRGAAAKVHYDPAKPSTSCLIAGVETWRDFMPLGIGLVVTGLGVLISVQAVRDSRRAQAAPVGKNARSTRS